MLRKVLLAVLILALIPFKMEAEWVTLDNNKTPNTPPKVTMLSDDNSSTVIKIEISGFDVKEFNSSGKTFHAVDLLSEMFTANPGYPEVPYIAKVLAIPDQSGISVEVLETGEILTFENVSLPPARMSWY